MLVTKIQAVTKQKYRIELDGQPRLCYLQRRAVSLWNKRRTGDSRTGLSGRDLWDRFSPNGPNCAPCTLWRGMGPDQSGAWRKLQAGEYPGKLWKRHLRMWNLLDIWMTEDMPGIMWNVKKRARRKARLKMELAQKGVDQKHHRGGSGGGGAG